MTRLSYTNYCNFANNVNEIINMDYREAVSYLFSMLPAFHRIGKAAYKANLNNTHALDAAFDHPHRNFRTVHVAGTNGKGSVSHMLASVLSEAGYKTGLYTSPHLTDFRERIRINCAMIPESEVISFIENHRALIERIKPSFFEMTVAMAFDYFSRQQTDVAIIETGMGGRLDSTNIITPVLSVITNIGHDHMEFLGGTPEAIAGEKAGIIKREVPVVVGEWQPETESVFAAVACRQNSQLTFADKRYKCRLGDLDILSGIRHYTVEDTIGKSTLRGTTPLGGLAQAKNIQTVSEAFRLLKASFSLSEKHLQTGISGVVKNTGLRGRWQILSQNPLIICDTGHNREGLEYVIQQLKMSGRNKLRMVLGFVNDKDLSSVLPLFPGDAEYYFTRASIPRALDEKVLRDEAARYGLSGRAFATVPEAIAEARRNASPDDLIFIGGSTFVVADAVDDIEKPTV